MRLSMMDYLIFSLITMSLFSPSHLHDHEKAHMSMSCSKLEFEIHINNDELLKSIWEHMREGERGGRKVGRADLPN